MYLGRQGVKEWWWISICPSTSFDGSISVALWMCVCGQTGEQLLDYNSVDKSECQWRGHCYIKKKKYELMANVSQNHQHLGLNVRYAQNCFDTSQSKIPNSKS